MESTKHLESPGLNLSTSKDGAIKYNCEKIKRYLENLFKDSRAKLGWTQCRMEENLSTFVARKYDQFDYTQFPGAQPISMERKHLDGTMAESQYLCCEKTDGVRFLCLVSQRQTLLIDRNYQIFECKFEKLPKNNPKAEYVHVFDGELVQDRSEDFIKFLIFDALVVNGVNVMNLTFENRLKTVKNQIIKRIRSKEYLEVTKDMTGDFDNDEEFKNLDFEDQAESNQIRVYLKDFFLDTHSKILLHQIIPKLDHGNDGLIFTMNSCPYYPGTCPQIIKWKPAVMNSVDFNLKLITSYSDTEYIWGLYTRTFDTPELLFDCVFFESAEENEKWRKTVAQANNANKAVIVECAFDKTLANSNLVRFNRYKRLEMTSDLPKEEPIKKNFKFDTPISDTEKVQLLGGWVIERQRTDKEFPNSLTVAKNIKETIDDPVTVDDIIETAGKCKDKYTAAGKKRAAEIPTADGNKRTKEN